MIPTLVAQIQWIVTAVVVGLLIIICDTVISASMITNHLETIRATFWSCSDQYPTLRGIMKQPPGTVGVAHHQGSAVVLHRNVFLQKLVGVGGVHPVVQAHPRGEEGGGVMLP